MAQTGTYIYRRGMTPETRTVVSQKIKVFSYLAGNHTTGGLGADGGGGFTQIGAMSNFAPSHTRAINPVRGLGFGDTIAELVPNNEEPVTIDVTRTALYLNHLWQSFGYLSHTDGMVRALKHHRWPFDVKVEEVLSLIADESAGTLVGAKRSTDQGADRARNAVMTYYEGCWFNSYSTTYTTDTTAVAENASITVTDITDGNIAFRLDMLTGNKFRSRIFNSDDAQNRIRNLVGQAGDLFGFFR